MQKIRQLPVVNHKILLLLLAYFGIVFWRLYSLPGFSKTQETRAIGGIVPHHLYVTDIIGDFFETISPVGEVDHIFLIGPDHAERGSSNITFSPPFTDQSMTALLPFIESTFPDSPITQVVLRHDTTLAECRELAASFTGTAGKNLLIASLDFSHYLPSAQAEVNDKKVMELINLRDYSRILKLNSDYLDSPPTLVTALMYFDDLSGETMQVLNNSNSGDRGNPYAPTTSYYSIVFYDKD